MGSVPLTTTPCATAATSSAQAEDAAAARGACLWDKRRGTEGGLVGSKTMNSYRVALV
jgi:hypothetical protein